LVQLKREASLARGEVFVLGLMGAWGDTAGLEERRLEEAVVSGRRGVLAVTLARRGGVRLSAARSKGSTFRMLR
jgi:hypothetical protein